VVPIPSNIDRRNLGILCPLFEFSDEEIFGCGWYPDTEYIFFQTFGDLVRGIGKWTCPEWNINSK